MCLCVSLSLSVFVCVVTGWKVHYPYYTNLHHTNEQHAFTFIEVIPFIFYLLFFFYLSLSVSLSASLLLRLPFNYCFVYFVVGFFLVASIHFRLWPLLLLLCVTTQISFVVFGNLYNLIHLLDYVLGCVLFVVWFWIFLFIWIVPLLAAFVKLFIAVFV